MGTELPEYFKCPISLEIMTDPVILSSGHTFDRASIQRWIDAGHRTCPITKLPLPDPPPLIPNHALRSLISNYTPHYSPPPQQLHQQTSTSHSLPQLISSLTSPKSSQTSRLHSLSTLVSLSKSSPGVRQKLAESGAVSAVLRCVDFDDCAVQEKALSLLLNLSLDDDNKVGLVAEGAVGKLVAALALSSPIAALAATVLTSLAVVEVNKATIGAYPGAVRSLVTLLSTGKGRERKEAATALFAICSFPENRRRAVDCGAVRILVKIARAGLERAVEVLGLLGKCKEGREEMVKCEGVVEILVGHVRNGSCRGVQYGLMALGSVCSCNERVKQEVINEGVLEICSRLIEGDNEKIRRVATSLAEVLKAN